MFSVINGSAAARKPRQATHRACACCSLAAGIAHVSPEHGKRGATVWPRTCVPCVTMRCGKGAPGLKPCHGRRARMHLKLECDRSRNIKQTIIERAIRGHIILRTWLPAGSDINKHGPHDKGHTMATVCKTQLPLECKVMHNRCIVQDSPACPWYAPARGAAEGTEPDRRATGSPATPAPRLS